MNFSSHPEHHKGYVLYVHGDEYLVTRTYSCHLADCRAMYAYTFGKYAKAMAERYDEVWVVELPDSSDLTRLRDRAAYHTEGYVSLRCEDGAYRPTIAAPVLFNPKRHKGMEKIDIGAGIQRLFQLGLGSTVNQINKPKWLKPTSDWDFAGEVEETDKDIVEEALYLLNLEKGRVTGRARQWSPEQLGIEFVRAVQGVGIDRVVF